MRACNCVWGQSEVADDKLEVGNIQPTWRTAGSIGGTSSVFPISGRPDQRAGCEPVIYPIQCAMYTFWARYFLGRCAIASRICR